MGTISSWTATNGGAFYIKDATSVTSTSNSISKCYLGDVGGAFYIENSSLDDTSSVYDNNAANLGGAFYCKTCTMTIKDATFNKHYSYSGGLLYLEDSVLVTLDNIQTDDTYAANNGGLVYAIASSSISSTLNFINTASITNSKANNKGGSFYIENDDIDIFMNTPITLVNS